MLPSCEACILAGGLSSRMGRDKSRLRLKGKTLLWHVRTAALAAGLPVRIIRRDLVPGCGPLGGVHTGLRTSQAELVLFLSCDMPFVTAALLNELLDHVTPKRNAVFLLHKAVGFPFVLRRKLLPHVEELLALNEFALHTLAKKIKAASFRLPASQEILALNVNTPDDYRLATQHLESSS
jgi:molybdopterin-guanine dinucleotide biosynthesis protein A